MKKILISPLLGSAFLVLLTLPTTAQTSWNVDGDGDYDNPANWDAGVPAASVDVTFGNVITAPRQVDLKGNTGGFKESTARTLTFDSAFGYTIFGDPNLVDEFRIGDGTAGSGAVTVSSGAHVIDAPKVVINGPFTANSWSIAGGSSLRITGILETPANKGLDLSGGGILRVDGNISRFDRNSSVSGSTTLEAYDGISVADRRTFQIDSGSTLRGNGLISLQSVNGNTTRINLNGILDPTGDGNLGTGVLTFGNEDSGTTGNLVVDFSATEQILLTLGAQSDKLVFEDTGSLGNVMTVLGRSSGTTNLVLDDTTGFGAGVYDLFDFTGIGSASLSDFDVLDFNVINNTGLDGSLAFNQTGDLLQFTVVPEPSAAALLIFGSAALLLRRRTRRS